MNQFPPGTWVYHYGHFKFFLKIRGDIRGSRCTTGVDDTGGKWTNIFNQKVFNHFVLTPLDSRVNIYINFCLQVHFKVSAAWYCYHYLPPVTITPVANLPPVSLTPVVHLDLRISPRLFVKVWNDPNVIFRGLGAGDSWKKPEAKNLVTLSLYKETPPV